jgi:vacuolar protein sorting-associated protein 13A/C
MSYPALKNHLERLTFCLFIGNLGRLQLNIPWRNFNTPLTAEIDDLFLLVNPASSSKYDAADDEKRQQAVKQERLRTAETLQMQGQADVTEGTAGRNSIRCGA